MLVMVIDGSGMNETVAESSTKVVLDLNEKIRVLHVDDDPGFLKITKQCLEMQRFIQVDRAVSVEEALGKLERDRFDVIVCDYQMPGKDGLDLLKMLRSNGSSIPFIMFTGKGREEVAIRALNLGADQYLNKVGETETVYAELAHSIMELAKIGRTKEELKGAYEKLQLFMTATRASIDGFVLTDLEGRILEVNDATLRLYGADARSSMIGMNSIDLVPLEERERIAANMKEVMAKGTSGIKEMSLITRKGSKITVDFSTTLVKDTVGHPVGFLGIIRDVTERKRAEEALKVSEEKYRSLFENSKDLKVVYDLKGNITAVNKVALGYGFRTNEGIGRSMLEFVPETEAPRLLKEVEEILQGRTVEAEIEIDTPKGKIILEYISSPIRERGEITGICGSYKDVTRRKRAEEENRESAKRYRELANSLPEIVFETDCQGKLTFVNEKAFEMTGFSHQDFENGLSAFDFFDPEEQKKVKENFRKRLLGESGNVNEYVFQRKDGSKFPVLIKSEPAFKGNTVTGVRGIVMDVSLLKKTK
jgi:PAS domain S-box-containing protein